MKSEIKGNAVIYNIEEHFDDTFAAFFYDDLNSYVNSKYYNYIIDIASNVRIESAKFAALLLSLNAYCLKNKGFLVISTQNTDLINFLKLIKVIDNFKIIDSLEKAMAKYIKQK